MLTRSDSTYVDSCGELIYYRRVVNIVLGFSPLCRSASLCELKLLPCGWEFIIFVCESTILVNVCWARLVLLIDNLLISLFGNFLYFLLFVSLVCPLFVIVIVAWSVR